MLGLGFLIYGAVLFSIALAITIKYDIKPQICTKEYEEKMNNI